MAPLRKLKILLENHCIFFLQTTSLELAVDFFGKRLIVVAEDPHPFSDVNFTIKYRFTQLAVEFDIFADEIMIHSY